MLTSKECINVGGHHFLGLTNPDFNLKRMHQLYDKIACLQNVLIDRQIYSYVKSESGYNIVLSAKEGTNASRGVMINDIFCM